MFSRTVIEQFTLPYKKQDKEGNLRGEKLIPGILTSTTIVQPIRNAQAIAVKQLYQHQLLEVATRISMSSYVLFNWDEQQ